MYNRVHAQSHYITIEHAQLLNIMASYLYKTIHSDNCVFINRSFSFIIYIYANAHANTTATSALCPQNTTA